jgi:hypothetical protein
MRYLFELAGNSLEDFADRVLKHESVHGMVLTVDPQWLYAWKAFKQFEGSGLEVYPFEVSCYHDYYFFGAVTEIDYKWRPSTYRLRSNIIVNIHLRPGMPFLNLADITSEKDPFLVRQMHRPVPRLCANPKGSFNPLEGGVSIGEGTGTVSGTLGGFLVDNLSAQEYGVTCGHIFSNQNVDVRQPSHADNKTASLKIGTCAERENPQKSNGVKCTHRSSKSPLNSMDVALIKIDSTISTSGFINNVGTLNGITPAINIHPGLAAECSARSGYHNMTVSGIGIVQEIKDTNGDECCMKELIQVTYASVASPLGSPVQSGDSGSWVIVAGTSGLEWGAMVIADDRYSAYGIMSEDIITFLEGKSKKYDFSVK